MQAGYPFQQGWGGRTKKKNPRRWEQKKDVKGRDFRSEREGWGVGEREEKWKEKYRERKVSSFWSDPSSITVSFVWSLPFPLPPLPATHPPTPLLSPLLSCPYQSLGGSTINVSTFPPAAALWRAPPPPPQWNPHVWTGSSVHFQLTSEACLVKLTFPAIRLDSYHNHISALPNFQCYQSVYMCAGAARAAT